MITQAGDSHYGYFGFRDAKSYKIKSRWSYGRDENRLPELSAIDIYNCNPLEMLYGSGEKVLSKRF